MNHSGVKTSVSDPKNIICPQFNFAFETIPLKISKPKLLIVEGRDEECFFCALIEHLGKNDIQVAGIGGKDKLRMNLKGLIKDPGFSKVGSLGIVRDADTDPTAAFQSVRESLRACMLPSPKKPLNPAKGVPRVAVMIIPPHKQQGALEDLCLEAIAEDSALICVDQYFACLDQQKIDQPKSLSKAKVRVFLASREDPTLPLGISAQKGYWPLDSKAFSTVKDFLKSL
jgi:hypothetical protein